MEKKREKLIIVGDTAFAEIAYEYFTYDSPYQVVAFTVNESFLKKEELFDLPVVAFDTLVKMYDPRYHKIFVATTYTKLNRLRAMFFAQAKQKGFSLATYVSSRAFVWRNVEIGENCFIFEHNVIQPFVKIGNNVILWSGNHIGHHSVIKDHAFIASHVVVSGFCEIGEYCFIGVNATLANNIKIAKDCLIGAGAVILKPTEEGKIYGVKMTPPKETGALAYFGVEGDSK